MTLNYESSTICKIFYTYNTTYGLYCVSVKVLTAIHILTPKIDVFSFVGVHWDIDHPKEISYSFDREDLVQEILRLKPNADTEDVEEFANSIQMEVEIVDWIEDAENPYRKEICMRVTQYDKKLQRKVGIEFYETVRTLIC